MKPFAGASSRWTLSRRAASPRSGSRQGGSATVTPEPRYLIIPVTPGHIILQWINCPHRSIPAIQRGAAYSIRSSSPPQANGTLLGMSGSSSRGRKSYGICYGITWQTSRVPCASFQRSSFPALITAREPSTPRLTTRLRVRVGSERRWGVNFPLFQRSDPGSDPARYLAAHFPRSAADRTPELPYLGLSPRAYTAGDGNPCKGHFAPRYRCRSSTSVDLTTCFDRSGAECLHRRTRHLRGPVRHRPTRSASTLRGLAPYPRRLDRRSGHDRRAPFYGNHE